MECLNRQLFEIGTREQRSTDNGDNERVDYDAVVMGETEVGGATVLEVETHYTRTYKEYESRRLRHEYVKLAGDGTRVLDYGYSDAPDPLCDTCKETSYRYNPPVAFRFDLMPGDEYEQTFVVSVKNPERLCFAVGSCPSEFSANATETIRYLGREVAQVPAGRFESCKFERVRTGSAEGGDPNTSVAYHEILWLDVGSGIEIRRDDAEYAYDGISESLVSGAIDGEPVLGD